MTCERCGADVITRYAGYTPVYRHAVPPKDAHYPKVPTPRSGVLPPSVPPMRGGDEPQSRSPEPSFPEKSSPAA